MATAGLAVRAARQVGPHPTRGPLGARAVAARLVDGADGRRPRPADDARQAAAVARSAAAPGIAEYRRGSTDPGPANLPHRRRSATGRRRPAVARDHRPRLVPLHLRGLCRSGPPQRARSAGYALSAASRRARHPRRSRGNGQRGRAGDGRYGQRGDIAAGCRAGSGARSRVGNADGGGRARRRCSDRARIAA